MSELKNDRYLKALLSEQVDMTPVWTVSYTHLDVYKRQDKLSTFMELGFRCSVIKVERVCNKFSAMVYSFGKIAPKLTALVAPVTLGKLAGKLCIRR